MTLKLDTPLVFFDLETTGLDIARDRIVELSLLRLEPGGARSTLSMRLNPGVHIPEASTAVHGITDEDVRDCPTFKDAAPRLAEAFRGCDLAGFNSNKFDIPLLAEEFMRAGQDIDLASRRMVDVQNIYHKLERRTLAAAYKYYCGKDLVDAHSALADATAACEVLEAQLDRYPGELRNDVAFLADFSRMADNVDLAGRFTRGEDGLELVNFGKYKGQPVRDVLRRDPGYYGWVMQGDFTLNTKQTLTRLKFKYASR